MQWRGDCDVTRSARTRGHARGHTAGSTLSGVQRCRVSVTVPKPVLPEPAWCLPGPDSPPGPHRARVPEATVHRAQRGAQAAPLSCPGGCWGGGPTGAELHEDLPKSTGRGGGSFPCPFPGARARSRGCPGAEEAAVGVQPGLSRRAAFTVIAGWQAGQTSRFRQAEHKATGLFPAGRAVALLSLGRMSAG